MSQNGHFLITVRSVLDRMNRSEGATKGKETVNFSSIYSGMVVCSKLLLHLQTKSNLLPLR